MHGFRRLLVALDAGAYRVERFLLLTSVLLMTALVSVEVVVRSFTRQVGKTAQFVIWLSETFTGGPLAAATKERIAQTYGPAFFWLLLALACVWGAHSSRQFSAQREGQRPEDVKLLRSLGVGTGVFIAVVLGIKLTVLLFPSGIGNAQKYSLGLLVWAGLLGAAIVTRTRGHIVLDAVKKNLDADILPWISGLGGLVIGAFCLLMAYLGLFKGVTEISEWSESGHLIHVYEGSWVPSWLVAFALPTAFGLIALRSIAQGLSDLLWGMPIAQDDDAIEAIDLELFTTQKPEPSRGGLVPGKTLYGRPHLSVGGQR